MLEDIGSALRQLGTDGTTKGIVLVGEGRAFSAGDDLPATESLDRSKFDELLSNFQGLTRAVLSAECPVVAALNGLVVGGAAEWTLSCDARVGWERSDFLFPENDVGLTISNASTYLLPRLIGSRALPIVLDVRRLSGTEAHALGLIDYFVDSQDAVLPTALDVLRRWVERGLATKYHLKLLRPRMEDIEAAIARENAIGAEAWDDGTALKGIQRFMREQEAKRARG
jgi:enoyl-CoA hydratase